MPDLSDWRHALRLLVRAPLFTLTAVLSLACGVAASSAVVSVADALLAPAVGVRDSARVVDIGRGNDGRGFDNMSHPAYRYLREHATSFDGMAAVEFGGRPMSLTLGGGSERVFGTLVSAPFFDVLGTRLVLGRAFRADEDAVPGERPVVVITHRFWTGRLGGDPHVLQRPLRLNNREFAVVGVAEPGFEGVTLAGTDLWLPMAMVAEARGHTNADVLTDARGVMHMAVGRLRAGISRDAAAAELNALMAQFKAATPDANPRHTVSLLPTSRVPGPMRAPFLVFLVVLFALSAALLAIACSNVAGLLLVRATARQREMATRLAMGASRSRLLAQLLIETALLFLIAGLLALPLTVAAIGLLNAALPALPIALNLTLAVNARVVAFALGVSLLTAVVSGLAPARHALVQDLVPLLHGTHATTDRRRLWLRHALVVAQVALSLMLVMTAGLFVRTLSTAAGIDPGVTTRGITLAGVDVSLSGYHDAAATGLIERIRTRLAALPGVTGVAAARIVPLQGSGYSRGRLRVPGLVGGGGDGGARGGRGGDDLIDADWNVVTPEYFDVVGMRLVAGRGLRPTDGEGSSRVAVVNETFARTAWPGRSALGQRLLQQDRAGGESPLEVVGVVADAKYRYLSETPAPFLFASLAQFPTGDVTFFARHATGALPAAAVRAAVADVAPGVAVMLVQPFDEAVALALIPQRLTAWVAGVVGSVGLALAGFGLYGLMAFLVAQRRREMAIRLALGASPAATRRLVLGTATRLGLAGAVVGVALAAGVGIALRGLLVGVTPVDPRSALGTGVVFTAVLAAAAWLPARRAAATAPAEALRAE